MAKDRHNLFRSSSPICLRIRSLDDLYYLPLVDELRLLDLSIIKVTRLLLVRNIRQNFLATVPSRKILLR